MKILVINPGSTSTKVSLFEDEKSVFERSVFHDSSVLLTFPHVNDQLDFRAGVMLAWTFAQRHGPRAGGLSGGNGAGGAGAARAAGAARPCNDLSRGCSVEDIVNTIAATAVQAQ